MTEQEIREDEIAQEEYRIAWTKASYIVAGWEVSNIMMDMLIGFTLSVIIVSIYSWLVKVEKKPWEDWA